MNSEDRSELDRLKLRLESLRREFDLLWRQTQELETRARQADAAASPPLLEATPLKISPLVPGRDVAAPDWSGVESSTAPAGSLKTVQPPPIPPIIPRKLEVEPGLGTASLPTAVPVLESRPGSGPSPDGSEAASTSTAPASFEMKLGTYWLVRIGIVMVLTAMVFFGNYAYHRVIVNLGPLGKVALMYAGCGVLLGLGAWWQRRQEALKNYAQVLFAGGLAGVYFTTYAAHHIENLRVIQSGVLDGILLLAWAGFMVWLADRRKSESLAVFAIGLAYYSSIITNVGLFTLYSNLVLTAAAVFFFVRNRWAALSFVSLLATYGGYAYWRFYIDGQWLWRLNLPDGDFHLGNLFLLGYWGLFTAAVFLSRNEKFAGEPRAGFLTLNNAAFFGLVILARWFVHSGSFWKFSLLFGATLLGLATLANRRFPEERLVSNSYLTQGLLLVTLGVMTYFTGLRLAAVLATESVLLLILADQRKNLILRAGSFLTAVLAVGWAVFGMQPFHRADLLLGAFVGALLGFNAWWSRRRNPDESPFLPQSALFSALALLIWVVATWNNTTREDLPLVLAVETVVFVASFYALRVPEIPLLGQLYLIFALAVWFFTSRDSHPVRPWWNPVLLIAITLGLSHWWQRQRQMKLNLQEGLLLQGIYALAITALLYFWLQPLCSAPAWLGVASLLAVGLTIYGAVTRAWLLAAGGQLFVLVSGWEFLNQLWHEKPDWYMTLVPMLSLLALSFGTVRWLARRPEASARYGESILPVALVYRWIALLMSLMWVQQYIPERERLWVLALAGAGAFGVAGWRKSREGLVSGAVFTAAGFWIFWFWLPAGSVVHWPGLFAILLPAGQQRLARRLPGHYVFGEGLHTAMILLTGVSLWRFVSRGVMLLQSDGFYLTVAWAGLALGLFVAGLMLRERIYRWLGLGVLGCALGRVVIFDVWKLETVYRILSLLALGIVLLVLGFLYNKYQEKIRQWL